MLRANVIAAVALLLIAGCSSTEAPPKPGNYPPTPLTERETSLYRHLIGNMSSPSDRETCFLTLTPMTAWGDDGDWHRLPPEFDDVVPAGFQPANDARLVNGSVHPLDSDAQSVMAWVTVLRWIDDSTAVVEEGNWCCPLGGGAFESTYELIDDEWTRTSTGGGWVS